VDRKEIVEKINISLGEVLKRDVSASAEETQLVEDLQMDSTAVLELLMALEDNLGFEVDPEQLQMDDFRTIGTLADYVGSAMDAAA
jgi:acyl carrier protein